MQLLRQIWLFLIDTVQTFAIAVALFLFVYFLIARPFQVSGDSMFPTYKDHEYIFTNLITPRLGNLQYRDVIVFLAPPSSNEEGKDFIKRIIGVPGDRIMLENGRVIKNGSILDEGDYLRSDVRTLGGSFLSENKEITVPDGHFFVLGDNRMFSSDSREWGFLAKKSIIGKSFFVYWPLDQIRLLN